MRTFRDMTGREWTVSMTLGAAKRVRSLTGVDLLKIGEGDVFASLANDLEKMVDVLFAVLKPQADAASVTDEQFAEVMGGDAMLQGYNALMAEIADFFPHPAQRATLRKALERIEEIGEKAGELAAKRLDDPDLEKELLSALSGKSSGKPPAASGSTPTT